VLKDYGQTDRDISYICLDIRERDFYALIEEAEKAIDGKIYLVDNNNKIISCENIDFIGKDISTLNGFNLASYNAHENSDMKINGDKSLVIRRQLPDFNWNIIAIVSVQNFDNKTRIIYISLLQVSVIAFLLSFVLAAFLSSNITGRITKLTDFIRNVDIEKQYNYLEVNESYKDEVNELIKAFNNMMHENNILVNEVYKRNLEKKSLEIKVLQAEINPHFLYNALDKANWMAFTYNAKDIMKFLKLLSNFYRRSLSGGRSIVSINDEIEHVRSYVDIQKIKTDDQFEVIYNIPPEILNYSIPKITLQPIVENAIIHGIQEADDRKGLIMIEGSINNSIIKLSVKDNGIGMNNDKLKEILINIQKESDSSESYGLKNVNQRIKHYFGDKYGINISSEYGRGTVVEIIFPALIINEEN